MTREIASLSAQGLATDLPNAEQSSACQKSLHFGFWVLGFRFGFWVPDFSGFGSRVSCPGVRVTVSHPNLADAVEFTIRAKIEELVHTVHAVEEPQSSERGTNKTAKAGCWRLFSA